MLRRIMSFSRYIIVLAVAGTLVSSIALIVYETIVVAEAVVDVLREGVAISARRVRAWPLG